MALGQVFPDLYETQLAEKQTGIQQLFASYVLPELQLFRSEPSHYRQRAEFRVWHEGDDLFHIMFDSETKQKQRIDYFPVACKQIADFMPVLLEELKKRPALRNKLYQIDYLSGLSGELLVSLIYKKPLSDDWAEQAALLKADLAEQWPLDFIGRSRKQKVLVHRDHIIEKLKVKDRTLSYQQIENSFTQPNAKVAIKMLEWAIDVTQHSQGDLLELYCGNGNFSIALAQNFNRVLATELAKPSVDAAQYNIEVNNIDNLQIIRMSAEEFSDAMAKKRSFRRLEGIDLDSYVCNTIFVDPPRAGIDPATLDLVQGYERILYISCNPDTLKDNLQQLNQTHKVTRFALFDQFPYTDHMETGVLLERR